MTLDTLVFSMNKEWEEQLKLNPWLAFVPEFAKDSNGQEFMRGKGRTVVYKIVEENDKGEQKYKCATCDSDIKGATVAHPIWDGPFPMSGSGQCHYEQVPYCPKCEQIPSSSGTPIEVGQKVR
ncbi:hypothetical protein JXB27_01020 [Candidatus Woesearchaeota archaeon]|nr:hypothetical protein [Candidatus Woesearchaeota archaeon]